MRNKKGFTLVEMIVVIVVIAILVAIAVPSVMKYIDDASDTKYLAQGRSVLVASNAHATTLKAKNQLSDEALMNEADDIIKDAEIEGTLLTITTINEKDVSYFEVQIDDKIVVYDKSLNKMYIKDSNEDTSFASMASKLTNGIVGNLDLVNSLFKQYVTNYKNGGSIDSEGPNAGSALNEYLKTLGIDTDNYSYRLYYKESNNNYTISISKKITNDMKGESLEVVQYVFADGFDKPATSVRSTTKATVDIKDVITATNVTVKTPVIKLSNLTDSDWTTIQ